MNISMILANSSTPKTMNIMGSMARGGMIEINVMNTDESASNPGKRPMLSPRTSPRRDATAMPITIRLRLDTVSASISRWPVRWSTSKAMVYTALPIWEKVGSILSPGFAACLTCEAVK